MNIYWEIIIRCIITLLSLLIMTFILGVKHIAQMTSFDYSVSIVIGSVGAVLCIETDIKWYYCVLAMAVLVFFAWLLDFLNRKTAFVRRYITGTPTLLILNGKILYKGLKHVKFNVNDLLREIRFNGYFDISEIEVAIMESNGQVTVLPKAQNRPVTTGDMNIPVQKTGLIANVIIDGKILANNLNAMNKTKEWLLSQANAQGIKIENVLLGTLNEKGELSLYEKDRYSRIRTILE
ncbi:MAG TPA: DUF421 domain-containing protein [Clostridia bacterium]|nr:DUF421 domain-containing protein [Clostridia bacterium]